MAFFEMIVPLNRGGGGAGGVGISVVDGLGGGTLVGVDVGGLVPELVAVFNLKQERVGAEVSY